MRSCRYAGPAAEKEHPLIHKLVASIIPCLRGLHWASDGPCIEALLKPVSTDCGPVIDQLARRRIFALIADFYLKGLPLQSKPISGQSLQLLGPIE